MLPLEGIKILDFTIGQQGPYATTLLCDMGADVIKVEEPTIGDFGRGLGFPDATVNAYFISHNRGKKGIAIDLKQPKGKEAILRLAQTVDVVVQNFRRGTMEKLGLGYTALSKLNPGLIYASASGYGPKGPWQAKPALDMAAQAAGGVLSVNGEADDPPLKVGAPVGDQVGGMILAYAITTALLVKERTGIGQEVDVSLFGTQLAMQAYNITETLMSGRNPVRKMHVEHRPMWNAYRCGDDKWIVLSMLQQDRYWPLLCEAIGRIDLRDDPRFSTTAERDLHGPDLVVMLDELFATRPAQEWLDILERHGLICAPVNSYSDLASHPQALENEYIIEYDHPEAGPIKMVGNPVRLAKTPANPYHRAPEFGEHTAEVLASVGYSPAEIAEMKEMKVIRTYS